MFPLFSDVHAVIVRLSIDVRSITFCQDNLGFRRNDNRLLHTRSFPPFLKQKSCVLIFSIKLPTRLKDSLKSQTWNWKRGLKLDLKPFSSKGLTSLSFFSQSDSVQPPPFCSVTDDSLSRLQEKWLKLCRPFATTYSVMWHRFYLPLYWFTEVMKNFILLFSMCINFSSLVYCFHAMVSCTWLTFPSTWHHLTSNWSP